MKRIPLTQGKFAIVDDDMYDYLMRWQWYALKGGHTYYAIRYTRIAETRGFKRTYILMHRVILSLHKDDRRQTDHTNHNGLDNRRCNIRICSSAENHYNQLPRKNCSSRYKGVCSSGSKWQSRIQHNGKTLCLGTYTSEIEAAKAYDAKAEELFGEFARLNIIEVDKLIVRDAELRRELLALEVKP